MKKTECTQSQSFSGKNQSSFDPRKWHMEKKGGDGEETEDKSRLHETWWTIRGSSLASQWGSVLSLAVKHKLLVTLWAGPYSDV